MRRFDSLMLSKVIVTIQTGRLCSMEQVRAFVDGSQPVDHELRDSAVCRAFVWKDGGAVRIPPRRPRCPGFERMRTPLPTSGFRPRWTRRFGGMSALATREVLRREFEVHSDRRFERVAGISPSHIHNLCASRTYPTRWATWAKTRPSPVAVTVRRDGGAERSAGLRAYGHLHLGDKDSHKGVGVVNAVDEVTQHEHVGVLPRISGAVHGVAARGAAVQVPVPSARVPRRQRLRTRQPPRRCATPTTTSWSKARMPASSSR